MMCWLTEQNDDNKFTYRIVFMVSLNELKTLLLNCWLSESRQIACFQRSTLLSEKLLLVIKLYVTSLRHKNLQYCFLQWVMYSTRYS